MLFRNNSYMAFNAANRVQTFSIRMLRDIFLLVKDNFRPIPSVQIRIMTCTRYVTKAGDSRSVHLASSNRLDASRMFPLLTPYFSMSSSGFPRLGVSLTHVRETAWEQGVSLQGDGQRWNPVRRAPGALPRQQFCLSSAQSPEVSAHQGA